MDQHDEPPFLRKATPLIGALIASWVVFTVFGNGQLTAPPEQPGYGSMEAEFNAPEVAPDYAVPMSPTADAPNDDPNDDPGFPAMPSP